MTIQTPSCPKRMEYGPCGGVEFDGSCEAGDFRCVFLDAPAVPWAGIDRHDVPRVPTARTAAAARMRSLIRQRPIVVSDFPARAMDSASLRECADILAGSVDAVLLGDAGNARVQFPPSYRAALVQQRGLAAWAGINNRDRNRVALEAELAALADLGIAGVHCVTGDHTLVGERPDAAPVFDLDSTETAALARAAGHLVSVAESPAAPPTERRAERLRQKVLAGADLCFVNHAGGSAPVARFIAEVADTVAAPGYIPCVPLVIDAGSAEVMRSFTTLVLPEGFIEAILAAADPYRAGIEQALRLAEQMLALDGVIGVNLSGGADGAEARFAEASAEVARRLAPA